MGLSEAEIIEVLSAIFSSVDPRVIVGIGDDAAVVEGYRQQILTTDIAVEGIHFRSDWSSAYEIGRRVAAANVADILSMNGSCDYLLVAATFKGDENLDWIRDLAQGIADQAREVGAIVVGGDLSRSPILSIAISAFGHSKNPILRSGAAVGDSIYLSSLTGWSAAGLEILTGNLPLSGAAVAKSLNEYRAPTLDTHVDFSAATSMCDVSDAIMVQGVQMANTSGVRFEIDGNLIAQSPEFAELSEVADLVGGDIWIWILQGGEDHALLATGTSLPGIRIGTVVEGSGLGATLNGAEIKMAPVAWSHF